jgi:nucleotide-binding universal stress UspA family protein
MPLATELAKSNGAELVIAHVDEKTLGKGGGSINAGDEDLRTQLRNRAQTLSDEGIETTFEARSVVVGGPAQVLSEIADDVDADLIVTGSRGHSQVSGLLLGSVANRLLQVAHQPVLVVPESAPVEQKTVQGASAVAAPA